MQKRKDRIEPIKAKFSYIMDDNNNDGIELTDEDKAALESLDRAWKDFEIGMLEAKTIIGKTYQDFKASMEEDIEEFRKKVDENKENFRKMAPLEVKPEFEADGNKVAFETI